MWLLIKVSWQKQTLHILEIPKKSVLWVVRDEDSARAQGVREETERVLEGHWKTSYLLRSGAC